MKALSLADVSVRFGHVQALAEVGLTLRAGEVTCLAGPNGAGKSTLLRVLLGLVQAQQGSLQVDGTARVVDNAFKARLGYLPEAVAFSDTLSGRRVLRFFARARGVSRARVEAVLEIVGLDGAARRAVRGYSRGMRQRLGLGVAILTEPELLVLDEPTSGLDQEGLGLLWRLLAEWRDAGRLVLMSSHELTLVERRIDQLCLLRDGQVCAADTPARLRERAALPVRVTFTLGTPSESAAFVDSVRAFEPCLSVDCTEGRLRASVGPRDLLGLVELRAGHNGAVRGLRVEEAGLDMVYEHLLQGGA